MGADGTGEGEGGVGDERMEILRTDVVVVSLGRSTAEVETIGLTGVN